MAKQLRERLANGAAAGRDFLRVTSDRNMASEKLACR
jgi:hypothetical protein